MVQIVHIAELLIAGLHHHVAGGQSEFSCLALWIDLQDRKSAVARTFDLGCGATVMPSLPVRS